jgi:pilus assembly protein CpaE
VIAESSISPYSSGAVFNCAIISPNPEVAEACACELKRSTHIGAVDCLLEYPGDEALARMVRLNAMELLVLDCGDLARAMEIVKLVHSHDSHIEILAICQEDVKVLSTLMRAGVRSYVRANATVAELRETLGASIDNLLTKPRSSASRGDVVAFLPSKPGSGASTVAAHTALAASRAEAKRVLLVDLDRDAPMQAFLNCLRTEHYLQEALLNSEKLDGDLWSQIISRRASLDILPADADGATGELNSHTQALLAFIRRAYDLTCVDLPGPLDPASVEVLLEARRVYLVCTQELASVHIAMRKADRLKRLGLCKEIRVVLNRYDPDHVMNTETVADLVGLPVELTVPNSYALARCTAEKGAVLDTSTPMGKSYAKLAQILLNQRIDIPRRERKFLEFFSQPFARREGKLA